MNSQTLTAHYKLSLPVKEGFFSEDHAGEHAAQTPHVQAVVVHLVVHQELGPLEVPAGHPHVVLLAGVVELGQPPVYEPQSPILVVDHDVVRLHVPVHDAHAVTVVQGTQQLVQIEPEPLNIFKIKP